MSFYQIRLDTSRPVESLKSPNRRNFECKCECSLSNRYIILKAILKTILINHLRHFDIYSINNILNEHN